MIKPAFSPPLVSLGNARLGVGLMLALTACVSPFPAPPLDTDSATTDGSATTNTGSTSPPSDDHAVDDTGPPSSSCGDGMLDEGEECDLAEANGTGDFCRDDCRNNVCGDGYLGPGETCDDGNDDNDDDCTNACGPAGCGNGVPDPGEECDEGADNSNSGACLPSCQMAECGDSFIQTGVEVCDNRNTDGHSCESQGFADGGTLLCNSDCSSFNTANCHECGNGMIEPTEECEGPDFAGATCDDYAAAGEAAGGELSCTAACQIDSSACTFCGDGLIEGDEDCEGDDLNGATCSSVNASFDGGTLACSTDCTFIIIACTDCGNSNLESGEVCDGADLGGATCASVLGPEYDGFSSFLACASKCQAFDTSGCCLAGGGTCLSDDDCCSGSCATASVCVSAVLPHAAAIPYRSRSTSTSSPITSQ